MPKNLFGNILNNILNESLKEGGVIVNPNNPKSDVFDVKTYEFKGKQLTKIKVDLDGEDIKKVEEMIASGQIDGSMFKQNTLCVTMPPEQANDPNSEGYQKIIKLCQAVSQLGKYGNINPDDIIGEAQFTNNQAFTPEKRAEVEKNEDELWDEFISKFDDPRIQQLLQSFHAYLPLNALDDRRSDRNIASILSQDAKRIAAGKTPATFVAKPQDWREMNRRIKKDAIPFYLWYRKDSGEPTASDYESYTDKSLGFDKGRIIGNKTAKGWATELRQAGGKKLGPSRSVEYGTRRNAGLGGGYGRDVYYDVADTEVIPGFDDIWNAPDREGLVDNIRWVPTKASLGQMASDNNMSVEELETAMGGVDTPFTIASYEALKKLCWDIKPEIVTQELFAKISDIRKNPMPTNQDGTPNMESIKDAVFDMATAYAANNLRRIARIESRMAKASMVACMFVGSHRIAPDKAIRIFQGLNKEELNAQADNVRFEFKVEYNRLISNVKTELKRIEANKNTNQQTKKVMEESIICDNNNQAPTPTDASNGMDKATKNFYSAIDSFMNQLGIDKDGQDDELNMSQEDIVLNEARFYHLFNKINKPRF